MKHMQHDFVPGPVAKDYGEILGAPFKVFLSNGVEEKVDHKTGKVKTEITDLPGLLAAVVRVRALHPRKLSGDDLRYIRSVLGLRSVEIAAKLDLTPEHYSRCENGTKTLSASAEKLYRMFVSLKAAAKDIEIHERLSSSSCAAHQPKEMNSETAKKAVEAAVRVFKPFLEMKIDHIYPAGEMIEFSFSREAHDQSCPDCHDEDGKWQSKPELEAA